MTTVQPTPPTSPLPLELAESLGQAAGACLASALRPIAARPATPGDPLFWQYPAVTEGAAFERHRTLSNATCRGRLVHTYLGLPWATWIDLENRHGAPPVDSTRERFMQRVRIGGYRRALRQIGFDLRVHTVCQHVYWRQFIPVWQEIGVTDVWLSHAPPDCADPRAAGAGLRLHPWRLFAVNWEDERRREGLRRNVDPESKPLLASFIGAHADFYPSDVRLRLRALEGEPGFHIEISHRWHFEDEVYTHQILGQALSPQSDAKARTRRYNEVLSDSRFALCPSGTGPNTLRLWEALAVGSVPVLLGDMPEMPRGGSLPDIDWDAIVVRVPEHQIPRLAARLQAMPLPEVRHRQALGLAAFAAACDQSCF